jgi:hypothetical protein
VTTDPSVKRIGVPLFKDRSGKLGLDARVTQAVMEELLKRGRFTVVRESTNVDAVVEGEIVAWNVLPVTVSTESGQTQASRYAISLTARDEYDMGDNAQTYFDREEQSIERLSAAFARSLVAAMLEAF